MKPYVICHMCTTVDGRILTSRWPRLPGKSSPARLFERTADSFKISAWLAGTTTMAEFADGAFKSQGARRRVERRDHIADAEATSFAIGADAKGKLRFRKSDVDGDHVVLLVTKKASDAYLGHLQDAGVSYLICGEESIDLDRALDKLRRIFRIRKLMLEGGGTFNGALLGKGLIDEISQVIVPVADGGRGVTTVFDIPAGPPRKAAAALRLRSQRTLPGGVIWLRYRVKGRARS